VTQDLSRLVVESPPFASSVNVALDIVKHPWLIVNHSDDNSTGGVQPHFRMNYPRDQGQRLGGTSHSSNYQHGPALSTSPIEKSRFRRPETSNQQQLRAHNSTQPIGPYSSPAPGPSRMTDRMRTPTRASTVGSTDDLHRNNMASVSDYGHHARSEDLNHGGSPRNINNNHVGRDPGPSPPFFSLSRPTTPGSSGHQQQQQRPQGQASSSGHSEHSEHHLSTASHSSESGATGKSAVPSATSAATSVASS
jgi:hypothetical protein